jgi:thiamine-monophosphate kinase
MSVGLNEFELIARLTRDAATNSTVVVGPGDDCAVLDLGLPDRWLLLKTDAVVEGVHFVQGTAPELVGRKALARCLSDVAAMAGTPSSAVVTIGLPPAFDAGYVERLGAGLNRFAREFGVAVVGGETTASSSGLFLSVALLGTVGRDRAVLRSGARAGDALFVTGELGGSILGKHLDFVPRVREAAWLASHFAVHAMIDLSDGLAGDLRHVLEASGVGAELLARAIPISRAAKERVRGGGSAISPPDGRPPATGASEDAMGGARSKGGGRKAPLLAALTDGEDFELLFAVAGKDAVPLLDGWKAAFPELRLSCLGKITAERGLRLRDTEGVQHLDAHGYMHFA